MLTQQRHEIILELLREKGSITVREEISLHWIRKASWRKSSAVPWN